MKSMIIILLIKCLSAPSFGQNSGCPCCTTNHQQFDFWLGDWVVFNEKGDTIGENKIIELQDQCIIQENWTSGTYTGTSYNYFDLEDNTWNQLYIDNTGAVLSLKGAFLNGQMVLESDSVKNAQTDNYYFNRITWQIDETGDVLQTWDLVNTDLSLIKTVFVGKYHRKS